MAAASVLANGTTAASSTDIVVAAPTVISLKTFGPRAMVIVELKDDAGGYNAIGSLSGVGDSSMLLTAAATYRATRVAANAGYGGKASDYSCGVFTG